MRTPFDFAWASTASTRRFPQPRPRADSATARERRRPTAPRISTPTTPRRASSGPQPKKCSKCCASRSSPGKAQAARSARTCDSAGRRDICIGQPRMPAVACSARSGGYVIIWREFARPVWLAQKSRRRTRACEPTERRTCTPIGAPRAPTSTPCKPWPWRRC